MDGGSKIENGSKIDLKNMKKKADIYEFIGSLGYDFAKMDQKTRKMKFLIIESYISKSQLYRPK